jgi:hypothetical protein
MSFPKPAGPTTDPTTCKHEGQVVGQKCLKCFQIVPCPECGKTDQIETLATMGERCLACGWRRDATGVQVKNPTTFKDN